MSTLYKTKTHKKAKQNKNLYTGLKLYMDNNHNDPLITYYILSTQDIHLFSKLINNIFSKNVSGIVYFWFPHTLFEKTLF